MLLYIDPGSGSLIVQAAIATLVAVPFILRSQLRRAVDLVLRRGRSTANDDGPGGERRS